MEDVTQWRRLLRRALVVAVAMAGAVCAEAVTLHRAGFEQLVADNATIVVGEVLEVHSYWNREGTFILSDVRVAVEETLKGHPGGGDLMLTVLGGTVGETTVLIVGGPELVPGRRYVLFAQEAPLPGVARALTLRDHTQAVFEVIGDGAERRAVSQARRLPLVPDVFGDTEPAGGVEGVALSRLIETVRTLAEARGAGREVKR